jgi:hypothetical protein
LLWFLLLVATVLLVTRPRDRERSADERALRAFGRVEVVGRWLP